MVLQGVRSNERRMIALGFPTFRYKLAAFVIAGAVCGIAGALFANLTLFISPSIMHWTRSGEIMMMVILGGIGTSSDRCSGPRHICCWKACCRAGPSIGRRSWGRC